jgi:hypothetical protein
MRMRFYRQQNRPKSATRPISGSELLFPRSTNIASFRPTDGSTSDGTSRSGEGTPSSAGRLIDRDAIHYQVTVEDPRVYTRPWTTSWAIVREADPGFELLEEAGWEGEQDLQNILAAGYKQYYYGETWRAR